MAADLRPRLRRPPRAGARPSLTPLVDVLLILVVFFLVTSTFLNLASLPMIDADAALPAPQAASADAAEAAGPRALLLRITAEGAVILRGRALDAEGVAAAVRAAPGAEAMALASPEAPAQALVSLMEAVAAGGGGRLRVIRPENGP